MLRSGLLFLALSNCAPPVEIKPPNVVDACARAVECGAVGEANADVCRACLSHIDESVLDDIEKEYGPIPPLETVDCDTVNFVVKLGTNIGECVDTCSKEVCSW